MPNLSTALCQCLLNVDQSDSIPTGRIFSHVPEPATRHWGRERPVQIRPSTPYAQRLRTVADSAFDPPANRPQPPTPRAVLHAPRPALPDASRARSWLHLGGSSLEGSDSTVCARRYRRPRVADRAPPATCTLGSRGRRRRQRARNADRRSTLARPRGRLPARQLCE